MLPDWKKALSGPKNPKAEAPAVMNVNFDGKTYSFEVAPGPDGYRKFTEAIRLAFELPDDSELNITFTCDEPTLFCDVGFNELELAEEEETEPGTRDTRPDPIRPPYLTVVK